MRFSGLSRSVALLGFTLGALAADPQKILFIGNSYTGVNKLPEVFQVEDSKEILMLVNLAT